ncbi:MAG: GNAT family N-acyltransferase [Pseudomonadota bacterium]
MSALLNNGQAGLSGPASSARVIAGGRFEVRKAQNAEDLDRALGLRQRAFRGGRGSDEDAFDPICDHILVVEPATGRLAACFRILVLNSGAEISRSYSAQFYDLALLQTYDNAIVELGRFCIDPAFAIDPDIVRLAWRAIAAFVANARAGMLFGCSSFRGTDPDRYADAFAVLHDRYQAPDRWSPGIKASQFIRLGHGAPSVAKRRNAMANMPTLLRSYLVMGGWVSNHAVIDHDLDTLHVFTGLEVKAIPATRLRALQHAAD